jgi:hypothetical protein
MASAAAPVLLVDNDVCLLKDIFGLEGRKVRACVDGTNRISQAQWEQIAITTGLRPLEVDWVPLSEDIKAKWAGHVPKPLQRLYLNGGVVWVREPAVFASTWAAHLEGIAKVFEAHPLRTHYVIGSDQVALSTAAAEHGGFDLLPLAYNCRPRCIRLGVTDPTILHLTRLSKAWAGSFSKTLAAYWDRRVILRIRRESERMPGRCAAREREQLLDEAVGLRDRVMRLGAEAGLDDFQL